MFNFSKVNNITGWIIFLIATVVYALTVEETGSFWDVGEFIAVSYKLEVPHPPGAPLFLLVGRLFSFLAAGDVTRVAYWINMVSVLSSSFSILFLFWTITLLGRKILSKSASELTRGQMIALMGAGAVGSLAYTFSDSFWFSAVEGEVYAMSSFFTAFVFWAILKWELVEDESQANKWLILIAFMMGLSIGVHLLNLVTIPALGFIMYFKKSKPTMWGIVATFVISAVIIMVIMSGVITGLPSIAGQFEIIFVNSLGLPFGSGIIVFGILFIGALAYGIHYSIKKNKDILNTALLCFTFVVIGYSSYAIIVIRSNFNPPINENDPSDIMSFISYLKREQYGDRPLFFGPYFTADVVRQDQGAPIYVKGKEKYEIIDYKITNHYDPNHVTILPRAYSKQPSHIQRYRQIMGLGPDDKPTMVDNLTYMFKHQLGHMYFRYFMWNFVGRESDIQDAGYLLPWDKSELLPSTLKNNKGRNNYYMLPLVLGLLGLFFQLSKDRKRFWVVMMFFFFTGIAIILYLNSPPIEPRERDYAYAGSFYVFAIWIGFGVLALYDLLSSALKNENVRAIVASVICLIVPGVMAAENWNDHDRSNRFFSVDSAKNFLNSCAPNAILFTGGDNDTFPLWYAQEVEGFRTDVRVVVLSYLSTDWYIEQMKRQVNESAPLPISIDDKNYVQGTNEYIPVIENERVTNGINLNQYLKLVNERHPAIMVPLQTGDQTVKVPSKKFFLPVNTEAVIAKGIIPEYRKDQVVDQMAWEVKGSHIEKNDLVILDIIATNNWERPIYFNNTSLQSTNLKLQQWVQMEGNAFRLLPAENPAGDEFVASDIMYKNLMENFFYRELDNPNVYYNEDYRSFVLNHRASFYSLAVQLINEGKNEMAKKALLKSLTAMPDKAILYDIYNFQYIPLLLKVGAEAEADDIAETMSKRALEEVRYAQSIGDRRSFNLQRNVFMLQQLGEYYKQAGKPEKAAKYESILTNEINKLER